MLSNHSHVVIASYHGNGEVLQSITRMDASRLYHYFVYVQCDAKCADTIAIRQCQRSNLKALCEADLFEGFTPVEQRYKAVVTISILSRSPNSDRYRPLETVPNVMHAFKKLC